MPLAIRRRPGRKTAGARPHPRRLGPGAGARPRASMATHARQRAVRLDQRDGCCGEDRPRLPGPRPAPHAARAGSRRGGPGRHAAGGPGFACLAEAVPVRLGATARPCFRCLPNRRSGGAATARSGPHRIRAHAPRAAPPPPRTSSAEDRTWARRRVSKAKSPTRAVTPGGRRPGTPAAERKRQQRQRQRQRERRLLHEAADWRLFTDLATPP